MQTMKCKMPQHPDGLKPKIWPLLVIFYITHNFPVIPLRQANRPWNASRIIVVKWCFISPSSCAEKQSVPGMFFCFTAHTIPFCLVPLHLTLWSHRDCPSNHLRCLWKINSYAGESALTDLPLSAPLDTGGGHCGINWKPQHSMKHFIRWIVSSMRHRTCLFS